MTIPERIEALVPMSKYGPGYDRNVTAALRDAQLFLDRDQIDAAEHYILLAETRAGMHTFEEYQALDPFTT